jgi:long-chain acyl-CoA synthetase
VQALVAGTKGLQPMSVDPSSYDEALARLTGPDSLFELRIEDVRGRPMRNFAKRPKSVSEVVVQAARHGERDFLIQGDRRIGYGEFARLVQGTALNLREIGLEKGDRLAILAYNSLDYALCVFAAASLGSIAVPLNGWWVEAEIDHALRDSDSRFLMVDERLHRRVRNLLGEIEGLETVFFSGGAAPEGTLPFRDMIGAQAELTPLAEICEDDPFAILYTSGTTGRPKGCVTTHRGTITQVMGILFHAMLAGALGEASPLPSDGSQPTSLMTSPLFHVSGLHTGLCTAIAAGAKVVFSEGRFDPDQVLRLIEREKVTTWGAIPTMLHRVVHSPNVGRYDLSSVTRVWVGGAQTPPETRARAQRIFPVAPSMTNGYGITETHGVVMLKGGRGLSQKPTAAGRPAPFFDAKIVDEQGREVANGELGELCLYGPTVTPGYWNRPDATAESIRDGWLHTGDVAFRDADGDYHIVDRAKDMVIRGGENVYCVEIENCLAEHPAIDEAAIVGVRDAELGERVKAVIHLTPGASLDEEGVRRHVAAQLAAFKVPELVEFSDTPLPRNPAGKILKDSLRGRGSGAFDPDFLG